MPETTDPTTEYSPAKLQVEIVVVWFNVAGAVIVPLGYWLLFVHCALAVPPNSASAAPKAVNFLHQDVRPGGGVE